MTHASTAGTVVIGVDDSTGSEIAVDWAGSLARARGWPVTLVYAFPDVMHPAIRGFAGIDRELRVEGRQIVDRVESRLRSGQSFEGPIGRRVEAGTPADVLGEASRDARLMVVGRRGQGGFMNMLIGSTAYSIAEHSACPVVVVPQEWQEREMSARPVLLGLDDRDDTEAIAFAFDYADATQRQLHAVMSVRRSRTRTSPQISTARHTRNGSLRSARFSRSASPMVSVAAQKWPSPPRWSWVTPSGSCWSRRRQLA
jgi:nucleotide-binding universal stress UspA family protein